MNWLDWVIGIIVAVAAFAGARRGFVMTVVRLASQVGSLIGAFLLTRPVSTLLEARFGLAGRLADFIGRYIKLPTDFAKTAITGLSTGELWSMLDRSALPEQYKDAIMTWMAGSPGNATVTLERFIHESLGMLVLNVLTFVVLVILMRTLLAYVGRGLSGTAQYLGAGGLDHLAGLALGAAQGILLCAVVLGLGLPLLSVSSMAGLAAAVQSSLFAPHLLSGFYMVTPWLRQIGQSLWERFR